MLKLVGFTAAVIPGVTTVSVSVFETLDASLPFPPYEAVMLYTPVAANDVWRVAFPLTSNVTVPSVVVAYEKITCPVGTAPEDWVTLAASVTLSPAPAVVFDAPTPLGDPSTAGPAPLYVLAGGRPGRSRRGRPWPWSSTSRSCSGFLGQLAVARPPAPRDLRALERAVDAPRHGRRPRGGPQGP